MPALTDPLLYSAGDPHEVWRRLREDSPVSWHEYGEHGGYWAVTTHAAGLEVLTEWERFTSTKGIFLRPNFKDPYPGAGTMMALAVPVERVTLAVMPSLASGGIVSTATLTR